MYGNMISISYVGFLLQVPLILVGC